MPKATPEDRACLDFAYRSVIGMSVEDEVIVLRDGITVATPNGIERLDASSGALPLLIHQLAQAMQLHVHGVKLGEVRRDLLAGGVGVKAANSVHDHLVDFSVEDWDRLRARALWYRDDNDRPIRRAMQVAGDS